MFYSKVRLNINELIIKNPIYFKGSKILIFFTFFFKNMTPEKCLLNFLAQLTKF